MTTTAHDNPLFEAPMQPDDITPDPDPLEAAAKKDKAPRKPRAAAKPRARRKAFDPVKFVGENIDTAAAFLLLASDPRLVLDGELLQAKRDAIAEAVGTVAKENPSVLRTLERLATASTYGALAAVLVSVVLPIAANHGLLPPVMWAFSREPDIASKGIKLGPPKPKPSKPKPSKPSPTEPDPDPSVGVFDRLRDQARPKSEPAAEPSDTIGSGLPLA